MTRAPRSQSTSKRRTTRRRLLAGGAVAVGGAAGIAGVIASRWGGDHRPAGPTPVAPAAMAPLPTAVSSTVTAPPAVVTPTPSDLPPLEHATVAQLRRALDARQLTARELVEACIARIEAKDHADPGLGAVIELNPEAVAIARALDEELAAGRSRGALHGIPVLVKDLFATSDRMATTAGSLALLDNTVVRDAFVVARLREAGVIVLGKANLTEWSKFRSLQQTSGWSARGGQTRNPYQLDMSPWGSSSGPAVAVAAGYVPLALGVETDGSIVTPASASAVVGMKPTVGLTSRAGVIPISLSQDSPGPLARTVEDVAYLLTAIAGFDPDDPAAGEMEWAAPAAAFAKSPVHAPGAFDYTRFLDADGLRGARIGVVRNLFYDAAAGAVVDGALSALAAAGAELVDPADIPSVDELATSANEFLATVTEFPHALKRYLAVYTPDGPMRSIADIVAFNEAHAAEWPYAFDQANFYTALRVGSVEDEDYREIVRSNLTLARDQGIDAVMDRHDLDALIAPTTGAPTLIGDGDNFPGACSQVSALAGYPIINVPVGYVAGLPVGISFMGRAFGEPTLLKLAYAFEQVYPVRYAPEFRSGSLA